jgi:hypothetical protein
MAVYQYYNDSIIRIIINNLLGFVKSLSWVESQETPTRVSAIVTNAFQMDFSIIRIQRTCRQVIRHFSTIFIEHDFRRWISGVPTDMTIKGL